MKSKPALLLTGASGYIGAHLLKELAADFSIFTCGRSQLPGKQHLSLDLSDKSSFPPKTDIPNIDILIHCASLTKKINPDTNTPEDYQKNNVEGTKNLLSLFSVKMPKYVAYISTCDVFGESKHPITERSAVSKSTPYSASKIEAESVMTGWCNNYSIPCALVRLGNIYGPGDEGYGKFIPVATQLAVRGKPILIKGAGRAQRDYLYITDVIRSIIRITKLRATGLYNSVSGEHTAISTLATLINALTNNPAGINFSDPQAPETDRIFNGAKLQSLGWNPQISMSEGLKLEIEYLKKLNKMHSL